MKNKQLLLICIIILYSPIQGICQKKSDIIIDFSKIIGKIKPLNGVNNGPFVTGVNADLVSYHAEAGFPFTRLHDAHWPSPDVVDIPVIFPFFDSDPDDPKNYNFTKTDDYLAPIIKNKSQIIYRLGTSIEHHTQYYIHPPKDYQKWARICVNIIRHYNEGWANGFHYNIKYWEIWNEPDLALMWLGTHQQYFELYEVAAKAIKAHNSQLKVGGPAATGVKSALVKPFLAFCRDRTIPLDFFSWHAYYNNPLLLISDAKDIRVILNEYGFKDTESHLNEWHFLSSWEELGNKLKDREKWSMVEKAFERTVGPEGAVFTGSALMLFQDSPIDVANFYCADTNPYSMFSVFGVPSKVYFVFKAFNQLLRTPNRVFLEGFVQDSSIVCCAGLSDDKKNATFLISNAAKEKHILNIALRNFPAKGKIHVEIYQVAKSQNLELAGEKELDIANPVLKLDLPFVSVCLIKLNRIP